MSTEEVRRKINELFEKLDAELSRLVSRVEELLEKGSVREAYREWRQESRRILRELKDQIRGVEELLERGRLTELEDISLIVRDKVREITDKLNELREEIAEQLGVEKKSILQPPIDLTSMIQHGIRDVLRNTIKIIEDIRKDVNESLRELIGEFSSYVVSVRLRKRDLDIIDKLIDAGIFKSRSEAVAFFTHKGIEALHEWISKALEKAEEIKRLRESLRKDIERELGKE
ncbi:MAG: hypothetical protein ABWW65_06325 [Thermoprotei archaeon]